MKWEVGMRKWEKLKLEVGPAVVPEGWNYGAARCGSWKIELGKSETG